MFSVSLDKYQTQNFHSENGIPVLESRIIACLQASLVFSSCGPSVQRNAAVLDAWGRGILISLDAQGGVLIPLEAGGPQSQFFFIHDLAYHL